MVDAIRDMRLKHAYKIVDGKPDVVCAEIGSLAYDFVAAAVEPEPIELPKFIHGKRVDNLDVGHRLHSDPVTFVKEVCGVQMQPWQADMLRRIATRYSPEPEIDPYMKYMLENPPAPSPAYGFYDHSERFPWGLIGVVVGLFAALMVALVVCGLKT